MIRLLADSWPLLLVAGALLLTFGLGRVLLPDEQLPLEKCPTLLGDVDHPLFRALIEAAGTSMIVFPTVRLADVVRTRPNARKAHAWQNRIAAHRLDFVLCDPGSLEARLAIRREGTSNDAFLEKALSAVKVPLLNVPHAAQYSADELRRQMQQLLESK